MTYELNIERRFTYHPPTPDQIPRYERIRSAGKEMAYLLQDACPPSAELTRAINAVEEAVMLANAAIARNG